MMKPDYYRERAAHARRLAAGIPRREDIVKLLHDMARDYDDIVTDLETGAIDIRHPELMPQRQRQ
jgi:hypothetical protein